MKAEQKKISKHTTRDGFEYLTKRLLISKAKSAGKIAAKNAMDTMGYIVTVQDGWVVKRYESGKIEQLQKL
ncbi:hypothetical protein DSL64_10490 [Dyadobacter luteus]|jgi:hypothetical protein|uniref:Uncharacterized protein n=1 Tax=Dyadobacter luteus TaxID=2259619 RepID=A0A3D8YD93_9BACT|nr:hypothetical protein [Dyadobacter luteus]REA62075.1 hypothetical protein DSL64_10490 [Dyadobacter luteus]